MKVVLPGELLRDGPTALRPWRDTDVASLARAARDPLIHRWTRVPENYTELDARAYLLHRYDLITAGVMAPFAIVAGNEPASEDEPASGALLGSISLMRLDDLHRRAEVGYWLAREARGQGHATRALRLICRFGVERLGLERIDLLAATANQPSQRVAERGGFTREALLRSYMATRWGRQDMIAFGLLAGELT